MLSMADRTDTVIAVRVPKQLKADIKRDCEERGLTVNKALRLLLVERFTRIQKVNKIERKVSDVDPDTVQFTD